MHTQTKLKSHTTKASNNTDRETTESARHLAELDLRLDKLSASRIKLIIAASKASQTCYKP